MISLFAACALIAMVLILWFKTEVWYEYTKLFGLGFLSRHKLYQDEKMNDCTMTYMKFLRKRYHRKFMIRMITCPICVCAWLSIAGGIFVSYFMLIPVLFIGSLILYGAVSKLLDI